MRRGGKWAGVVLIMGLLTGCVTGPWHHPWKGEDAYSEDWATCQAQDGAAFRMDMEVFRQCMLGKGWRPGAAADQ